MRAKTWFNSSGGELVPVKMSQGELLGLYLADYPIFMATVQDRARTEIFDAGKVTVSLAEAVEIVKSLPEPSPATKRISEWNRVYREQK